MARINLNVGTNANDGTGDTLRQAMQHVNTMFTELYNSPLYSGAITVSGNSISANRSNDDLVLAPNGTGTVTVPKLLVDSQIQIKDNEITTTQSNSDLVLTASGSGTVLIANADINGGNIDDTTIGATTPSTGVFTTVTATTSAVIDGITISDNLIVTNSSNANLELSGNGTGTVVINGLSFPTADGTANQFLKTDGSGTLSFATSGATLNHSEIADDSVSVTTSATTAIDSWSSTTYRSAKYYVSVTDTTNSRFEIIECNLIHGPSADSTTEAFIATYGSTTNHTSSLVTLSADVLNGNVRLLCTNDSASDVVCKFQRLIIDA